MSTSSFTDLLEEDFRWPAVGDKLFSVEQPAYGAFLGDHPEERLYHLTGGYKARRRSESSCFYIKNQELEWLRVQETTETDIHSWCPSDRVSWALTPSPSPAPRATMYNGISTARLLDARGWTTD